MLKQYIKKLLPPQTVACIQSLREKKYKISYSQEGEDILLDRIFNKASGFYIDVGAHHPKRFSNTYFFYKIGWRGINIDAMPGSMNRFKKNRPYDINIEAAVGLPKKKTYYIFEDKALNTFSKDLSDQYSLKGYKIIDRTEINIQSLSDILEKNIKPNQKIDFLTIDVEGNDLEVLKSNNWEKYRPTVILVEQQNLDLEKLDKVEVHDFLKNNNYVLISKLLYTTIYKLNE